MTATLGYHALMQPGLTYKYTKLTEFFCGCVHRTLDEFHLCPTHQAVKTRIEEFMTDEPPAFRVPPAPPLINTSANSLYSETLAHNPTNAHSWPTGDTEYGLCYACLCDQDEPVPTRNGACGCPNSKCPYRWCGRTSGRHALYRAHVSRDYGRLAPNDPLTLEDDLFEPEFHELSDEHQAFFAQERAWLEQHTLRLSRILSQERRIGRWSHPLTWLNWLPKATRRSNCSLQHELTHLICLGVIHPPTLPPSPANQLKLPMKDLQPAADTFHFHQAVPTPAPPR